MPGSSPGGVSSGAGIRPKWVSPIRVLDTALARRARRSPLLRPPAIAAFRALDRLTPAPPGPKVIANSMPKSGTHLLAALLDQIEGMRFAGRMVAFDAADAHEPERPLRRLDKELRRLRSSHYIGGHLVRDPGVEARLHRAVTEDDVRLLTIMRDPRAIVVSGAHYVLNAPQLRGREDALRIFPDYASIVRAMVQGHGEPGDPLYFPEIGARYASYAAWADFAPGLLITFERLIGARGGGSDEDQRDELGRILDYLGYDAERAERIAGRLFSENAITFRSGRVDSWADDLPADLAAEILERCREPMRRLGYVG